MQTIGEKLEEARKRRGIAIREASEFTKIRGEYLAGFETNSFDINLPEIYVRGFLRTYAQFLKLNPEKVITDYSAYRLGESKIVRRESKELLGRMDLPESGSGEEGEDAPRPSPVPAQRRQPGTDEDGDDYGSLGRSNYPKVAAVLGSAFVVAIVLVFVVVAVIRSGPTEAHAADANLNGATASLQEVTLRASEGDILSLKVTEISTGEELFSGPLPRGESLTVPYDERVRISWSNGQYLVIQQGENSVRPGRSGPGQAPFP